MKASQIDSIKKIQQEIEDHRRIALGIIEVKDKSLPKLEEELYKLEVKYKKVIEFIS